MWKSYLINATFPGKRCWNSRIRIIVFPRKRKSPQLTAAWTKAHPALFSEKKSLSICTGDFFLERHTSSWGGLSAWGKLCFLLSPLAAALLTQSLQPLPLSVLETPLPTLRFVYIFSYHRGRLQPCSAALSRLSKVTSREAPIIVFVNVLILKLHVISVVYPNFFHISQIFST